MEANSDSAPDAIPEHIVAQHVREARITVVSSHYLRNLPTPGKVRELYERLLAAHSRILIPVGLAALSIGAVVLWLATNPESTPLFVGTSAVVVTAAVVLGRYLIGSIWLLTKRTKDPSDYPGPMT